MNDSNDDFEYDSVVSNPDLHDGVIDNDSQLDAASNRRQAGGAANVNILTPNTARDDTLPIAERRGPSDSNPSLAAGTPNAGRFPAEYDMEEPDMSNFSMSVQSHFGQKSGMYAKTASSADFAESQKKQQQHQHNAAAAGDATFDMSSFNESENGTVSRGATGKAPSVFSMPAQEMEERRPAGNTPYESTPRKVSFAPPYTAGGVAASYSTNYAEQSDATQESIVFRDQHPPLAQARPPWDDSHAGRGEDATELIPSQLQRSISPMIHLPLNATRLSMDGIAGVGGVGMGGGGFLKRMVGWTRSNMSPLSPNPATQASADNDHDDDLMASGGSEDSGSGNEDPPKRPFPSSVQQRLNNNATVSSHASSRMSTSSTSPVRTEPMRSQVFLNLATTPTSARASALSRASFNSTTPRRQPRSSRKVSNTPLRSVNPLARHLALKAIRSTPTRQRRVSLDSASFQSQVLTPNSRGRQGFRRMGYSSPGNVSINGDASMAEASVVSMTDIQQQLDGFASMLKHDASAVQADVLESEQAWRQMQQEMYELRVQLLESENKRDLCQRQVEQAENDRAEWEAERQLLTEDKFHLLSNIEQWRKRIGSVESNRQGGQADEVEERDRLLYAIVRLEDALGVSRQDANDARKDAGAMASKLRQLETDYEDVCDDLEQAVYNYEDKIDELSSDISHMQAEMFTKSAMLVKYRDQAKSLDTDLQRSSEENNYLGSKLAGLERQFELARVNRAGMVAETLRARESGEQMRKQLEDRQNRSEDVASREVELAAEIAQLKEANSALKDSLEDLIEKNRKLKGTGAHDESHFFATAMVETGLPLPTSDDGAPRAVATTSAPVVPISESEVISKLKAEHREESDKLNSDRELLIDQIDTLVEQARSYKAEISRLSEQLQDTAALEAQIGMYEDEIASLKEQLQHIDALRAKKDAYKAETTELLVLAEEAQTRIEYLEKQLNDLRSQRATSGDGVGDGDGRLSGADEAESDDLTQLKESEEQLRRELDRAERIQEGMTERQHALEDRNHSLASRNEELSQRIARYETELDDLRDQLNVNGTDSADPSNVEPLRKRIAFLERTVEELEADLRRKDNGNDNDNNGLRQEISRMDAQLDDAQMELLRVNASLDSEKAALKSAQDSIAKMQSAGARVASTIATTSLNADCREVELSQTLDRVKADVLELEEDIERHRLRQSKLKKEKHYLAHQLMQVLNHNATLRQELTEFLLRRAGKVRELKLLQDADQRLQGQQSGYMTSMSDDGSGSGGSSFFNMVPSTSMLMDGSKPDFLCRLDKHLVEMENIIDNDNGDDKTEVEATGSANVQRVQQLKSSPLRRSNSLQPPSGLNSRLQRKVLTPIREEFNISNAIFSESGVQCDLISDELMAKKIQFDEELKAARDTVYRLEEDVRSLRTSVSSARQERDQFRLSQEEAVQRVAALTGQIEDLSESQERMKAFNDTTARVSLKVNRQFVVLNNVLRRLKAFDSAQGGDDSLLTQQEIDDKEYDLGILEDDKMRQAVIDRPLEAVDFDMFGLLSKNKASEGGALELNTDEALEQLVISATETYGEIRRLRGEIIRANAMRSRLMKRAAEKAQRQLPSYELSSQWTRNIRQRSYTDGLVITQANANNGASATVFGRRRDDTVDDNNASQMSGSLLEDTEPPASPDLSDESAAAAIQTASALQNRSNESNSLMANLASVHSSVAARAELIRLEDLLKERDHKLRKLQVECTKLAEFNTEYIQQLDRQKNENNRLKHDCISLKIRVDNRSANRTMTPSHGTDWNNLDSVEREMEKCKGVHAEYVAEVSDLLRVLNQQTLDQALVSDGSDPQASTSSLPDPVGGHTLGSRPAKATNMFRTLLMDLADKLDAKHDLEDNLSIGKNFENIATAIRQRLHQRDTEIRALRDDLNKSRAAADTAFSNSMMVDQAATTTERQLCEARAEKQSLENILSSLEQQLESASTDNQALKVNVALLEEELDRTSAHIGSLENTVALLKDQNTAIGKDVSDLANERDEWYHKHQECTHSLTSQEKECERLNRELQHAHEQGLRYSCEAVPDQRLSVGGSQDSRADADLQLLRQKWVSEAQRNAAEEWCSMESALRESYDSQMEILEWARDLWIDTVISIMDLAEKHINGQSAGCSEDFRSATEGLRIAVDELDVEVRYAMEQVESVQNGLGASINGGSNGPVGGRFNRAKVRDDLNNIKRGLNGHFNDTWRTNLRKCIIVMTSILHVGTNNSSRGRSDYGRENNDNSPPSTAATSSNSSENHPLSHAQKERLRQHMDERADRDRRKHEKERNELIKREKEL
ncbi:hypothetical protein LPJ66_006252, partial [Kickxella alabastrina]